MTTCAAKAGSSDEAKLAPGAGPLLGFDPSAELVRPSKVVVQLGANRLPLRAAAQGGSPSYVSSAQHAAGAIANTPRRGWRIDRPNPRVEIDRLTALMMALMVPDLPAQAHPRPAATSDASGARDRPALRAMRPASRARRPCKAHQPGGTDHPTNLQQLCADCNLRKRDR